MESEESANAKGVRVFRQEADTPITFRFAQGRVFLFDGGVGFRVCRASRP